MAFIVDELKRLSALPGDIGRIELAFWMADNVEQIISELELLEAQAENFRCNHRDSE